MIKSWEWQTRQDKQKYNSAPCKDCGEEIGYEKGDSCFDCRREDEMSEEEMRYERGGKQ